MHMHHFSIFLDWSIYVHTHIYAYIFNIRITQCKSYIFLNHITYWSHTGLQRFVRFLLGLNHHVSFENDAFDCVPLMQNYL